jgi:hypothetical protein
MSVTETIGNDTPGAPDLLAAAGPDEARLLGWARAADEPRVCVVNGPDPLARARLLAWLTLLGMSASPATASAGAAPVVNSAVVARGTTLDSLTWLLAADLGYPARTPAELAGYLAADARPVLIAVAELDQAGFAETADPAANEEAGRILADLLGPLSTLPGLRLVIDTGLAEPGLPLPFARIEASASAGPASELDLPDLAELRRAVADGDLPERLTDPSFVAAVNPIALVAALDQLPAEARRPLRSVVHSAGPALVAATDPAERAALVRLAALFEGEPTLAAGFEQPSAAAAWRPRWARSARPGSPTDGFPVTALAPGHGTLPNAIVAADPVGAIHALDVATGATIGRIGSEPWHAAGAVAALADGTLLFPDASRVVEVREPTAAPGEPPRISSILDPSSDPSARRVRLVDEVRRGRRGEGAPITLTAGPAGEVLALADADGTVQTWWWQEGAVTSATRPATGLVTALACLDVPRAAEAPPVVFTGHADGTVRLWPARSEPAPGFLTRRQMPVAALAAAVAARGPLYAAAWADGVVEVAHPGARPLLSVRFGWQPRTLLLLGETVIVAGAGGVAALELSPPAPAPEP